MLTVIVLLELVFLREFRTVLVVLTAVALVVLTIGLVLTIVVVLLELIFLREFRELLVVLTAVFLVVLAVRLMLTVVVVLAVLVVLIVHDFHLLSKFGGMLANFFLLHILKILAFAFDQGFLVIGAQLVSHLILVIVLAFPGRTLILAFTIIHHFSHLNDSMAVFVRRHSGEIKTNAWEEMEKAGVLHDFPAELESLCFIYIYFV